MQVIVDSIKPDIRSVDVRRLRGPGLLGGGIRTFAVPPSHVALIRQAGTWRMTAPRGDAPETVELPPRAAGALLAPREQTVRIELPSVRFRDGEEGSAVLRVPLRILTPEPGEPHPILHAMPTRCTETGFHRAIGEVLAASLIPHVARRLAGTGYDAEHPQMALSDALAGISRNAEFAARLQYEAGIALAGEIAVERACCPRLDALRQQFRQSADAADRASGRAEHVCRLTDAQLREQSARHRVRRQEIEQRLGLAELAGEHRKRAQLAELEVDEARATAARLWAEAGGGAQLRLIVSWQAHDRGGVLVPHLGARERLPSGTFLSTRVSVSRDAWVIILARNSAGRWQRLVPDEGGAMGITRGNRQRANETVTWPGANRYCPELPFWCLDSNPGRERLIVAACERPIGVAEVLHAGASPRGLCAAGGAFDPDDSYHRVTAALLEMGCRIHETVIEHVAIENLHETKLL